MAFASSNAPALSEMNITPLIDVMMVLLVIFMVTAPMVEYQMDVDLPQPGPTPLVELDHIRLHIAETGELSWNGLPMPAAALSASLRVEATRSPQPVIEIDTADQATYQQMVAVLAETRRAGLTQIGFAVD